jgi:hypothetical protein
MRRVIVVLILFVATSLAAQDRYSLSSKEFLNTGEWLVSPGKAYIAYMQPDGNFCIYRGSSPAQITGSVWCSMVTSSKAPFVAVMQTDGNFVVYSSTTTPATPGPYLWATMSRAGGLIFNAAMQDDGNFVVRSLGTTDGKSPIIWQVGTGTGGIRVTPSLQAVVIANRQTKCPPDCTLALPYGTAVQFSVMPLGGAHFVQWTGACEFAKASPTCTLNVVSTPVMPSVGVQMAETITLTARATIGGSIETADQLLKCNLIDQKCVVTMGSADAKVITATINAVPQKGYRFAGWLADCAPQGNPCMLTMDRARAIGAEFVAE